MSSPTGSTPPVEVITPADVVDQDLHLSDRPFEVPAWFVEENVQRFVHPPVAVEQSTDGTNHDSGNDTERSNGQAHFECPGQTEHSSPMTNGSKDADAVKVDDLKNKYRELLLAQIRDVINGSMTGDGDSALSAEEVAVIIGANGDGPRKQEHIDCFVRELARAMHANTISLDLDDLEALSVAFSAQENAGNVVAGCGANCSDCLDASGKPQKKNIATLYFAAPCKRKTSPHITERTRKAVTAVLRGPTKGIPESAECAPGSDVSLVYIREAQRILNMGSRRVFSRFREAAEEERRAGRKVMLLVAEPIGDSDQLQRKLKIGSGMKFLIDGPEEADEAEDQDAPFTLQKNLKVLLNLLRSRLTRALSIDLVPTSSAEWKSNLSEAATTQLGDSKWQKDDLRLLVLQILGRAAGKPMPEVADVNAVLERCAAREEISDLAGGSDNDSNPDQAPTLAQTLEMISDDCNKYEKTLFNCVVDIEALDSTFDNVIIDPETKNNVRHLVALSGVQAEGPSHPLLREMRVSGALFYGPPGTGKTHLVRAIAKESGLRMIALKSSDVRHKWVGESEKLVNAAFSLADKLYPSVVFIDEADAIFFKRSPDDMPWQRAFLTQMLQELDGLVKSERRPFVVVATNRPSDLDEAFLRRLPHRVQFRLPSEAERAQILGTFVKEGDLDPLVSLDGLAGRTAGFSGSDLRTLCAQAALAWATESNPRDFSSGLLVGGAPAPAPKLRLTMPHFEKALRMTFPSVSAKAMRDVEAFARR